MRKVEDESGGAAALTNVTKESQKVVRRVMQGRDTNDET